MQRLPHLLWGGALCLTPFVFLPIAIQPAGPIRWLWLQIMLCGASFILPKALTQKRLPTIALPTGMALLCLALLSVMWATDKGAALLKLFQWITGFQFLVLGLVFSERLRRITLYALVGAGSIAALIGALQVIDLAPDFFVQTYSPSSSFVNRNQAAEFVAALSPIALIALCLARPGWYGTLASIGTGLCWFFVVASRSRASWLALAATSIFMVLLVWRHPSLRVALNRLPRWRILGRIAVALFTVFAFFPSGQMHESGRDKLVKELASIRSVGIVEGEGIDTVAVRKALWRNSVSMFAENPFGVGLGNFSLHYPRYHHASVPTPTYDLTVEPERLHNDFYQVLLELGLPGLLLSLIILVAVYSCLRRSAGMPPEDFLLLKVGPLLVLTVLGINSLFSFPLHIPLTSALFWLCCGLCLSQCESQKKSSVAMGSLLLFFNLLIAGIYAAGTYASILRGHAGRAFYSGKVEQAIQLESQALHIFSLDWRVLDELVSMACSKAKPAEKEVALAEAFVARRPYSPNGWYRLAFLYLNIEQPQKALQAVNRSLDLLGPSEKPLRLRARIYEVEGNMPAAKRDIAEADRLAGAQQ